MRIVFLGTPEPAVPTLLALLSAAHEIPLVVTQPDRLAGRSGAPQPPPVKRAALEVGLRVEQPRKVRTPAFRELLGDCRPDLLVVVAYGRILPAPVLELPRLGPVNVHFSLLPALRGAAPVQWALARGLQVTGVSTMLMNEGLDEGDLLLQRRVPIEPGEHAPSLTRRLAEAGAELLLETAARLEAGTLRPRPQDHAAATHAPILAKGDGDADPRMTATELEGRVRGFDPWPGVWLSRRGKRLRILEARARSAPEIPEPPGTVVPTDSGGLALVCGGGSLLELDRIQIEGRRAVSATDARNGRQLEPGDRLEPGAPAD